MMTPRWATMVGATAGVALSALFASVRAAGPQAQPPPQSAASASAIYHDGWIDLNKNGRKDSYEDQAVPIDARLDDLLAQMTLQEKTCQLATLYGYRRVLQDPLPTPQWKHDVWKDAVRRDGALGGGAGDVRGARRPLVGRHSAERAVRD